MIKAGAVFFLFQKKDHFQRELNSIQVLSSIFNNLIQDFISSSGGANGGDALSQQLKIERIERKNT